MEEVCNRIYNTEDFAKRCKRLDLNKSVKFRGKVFDVRIVPAKSNWTWFYKDEKGFWGVELYTPWNREVVYITSANYYFLEDIKDVN